jgi:hypothetical protein
MPIASFFLSRENFAVFSLFGGPTSTNTISGSNPEEVYKLIMQSVLCPILDRAASSRLLFLLTAEAFNVVSPLMDNHDWLIFQHERTPKLTI